MPTARAPLIFASRERQSVRNRASPDFGLGIGNSSSRKSLGLGSPTGREASTMRRSGSTISSSPHADSAHPLLLGEEVTSQRHKFILISASPDSPEKTGGYTYLSS